MKYVAYFYNEFDEYIDCKSVNSIEEAETMLDGRVRVQATICDAETYSEVTTI